MAWITIGSFFKTRDVKRVNSEVTQPLELVKGAFHNPSSM
ncbi:hypothetical protein Lser_V15G28051 [Lactuca serriola]